MGRQIDPKVTSLKRHCIMKAMNQLRLAHPEEYERNFKEEWRKGEGHGQLLELSENKAVPQWFYRDGNYDVLTGEKFEIPTASSIGVRRFEHD